MPKTLWNEGRVTGLSIFEIYLRYLATEAPELTPATEKEFMSAMLTMGNSVLLRVGTDDIDGVHFRDIPLPASSKICAANTIFGSFFAGSGAIASDADNYTGWAVRVTDYGPLIENNSTSSPSGDIIPPTDTASGDLPDNIKEQIPEYLKIIDGVVLQPGTWTTSDIQPPEKDFKPNMSKVPFVRLSFSDKVEKPFFLLLTGFSAKLVTSALTTNESSLETTSPSDGDFLGPWVYPWANKIVFSVPPVFLSYIESVKIATEDMAKLQMYNTRYIWLYRMGEGATLPTQADLQDTRSLYQLQGVIGSVSDYFMNTYCVSYAEAVAACAEGHLSDGYRTQLSCVNQIVDTYGTTVAQNDYVYFLWSNVMFYEGPGQQGIFLPISKKNKTFSFALTKDTTNMIVDHGINFSLTDVVVDDVTVTPTNTDVLGGLFGRTGADAGKEVDADGNIIFQDHPVLHNVVKEFSVFTRPDVAVPDAPTEFNGQFVDWFSSTMVTDILSAATLQAMNVHSDYRKLDFQSFLQYAASKKDLTQPIATAISDTTPVEHHYFIYRKTDIQAMADPAFTWTAPIASVALATADMPSVEYYKATDLYMKSITVTISGEAGSRTATYTVNADITQQCTNSNYHRWAATATSNDTQTAAISLIDGFGAPLSTAGSSGSLPADVLRWSDMLDALSQNKAIDLLGGLLNLKNSGNGYVQIGDVRLYVTSTAPTDNVPEGAIGIGWGSGVYKYTSGTWVSL